MSAMTNKSTIQLRILIKDLFFLSGCLVSFRFGSFCSLNQ